MASRADAIERRSRADTRRIETSFSARRTIIVSFTNPNATETRRSEAGEREEGTAGYNGNGGGTRGGGRKAERESRGSGSREIME